VNDQPPWEDPDVKAWLEDARANLIPMIRDSDVTGSLIPSTLDDVKYALELGLSIMMDKPIIAIVIDDRPVPKKMFQVADAIVHMDGSELGTAAGQKKVMEAVERVCGPDD
jgi:hypothetical protein